MMTFFNGAEGQTGADPFLVPLPHQLSEYLYGFRKVPGHTGHSYLFYLSIIYLYTLTRKGDT